MLKKIFRDAGAEFFSLACDEVHRNANQQMPWLNVLVETMAVSLLGKVVSWTYLVKASVMHKMNFFPFANTLRGPNRLA